MNKPKTKIKRIAMLSTHGYFDPVPQLGQTDTGGQVMYGVELAKALTKYGIEVDFYTRWFDKARKQIDVFPGYPKARVIRIPAGPWKFIIKEELYPYLPELSQNMIKFIKDNNLEYDLYHGHYVDAGIVALAVAKEFKKPVFFTPHSLGAWKQKQMGGDPDEMEKKYKFKHRIAEELRIFKSINAQILTTMVQHKTLEELYEFKAKDAEVIHAGVNICTYHLLKKGEKKRKLNLPKKYIFCLSRIDANKGHDLLLYAFDHVRKKNKNITLVIGGGSPKPKTREQGIFANMRKIIDKRGMQDRVVITGYIPDEDLVPCYQQADMFVMPSTFEPFGMTTLEAMACCTPVIVSKFGGIREVIDNGKNGFLIDPTNAEEFAEAMLKLLNDKVLAKRMAKAGCATAKKHYSWEVIAEQHLAFYKKYMKD